MQPDSRNDSIDAQIEKIEAMRAKFLKQDRTSPADRKALNQAVDNLKLRIGDDDPQIQALRSQLDNECIYRDLRSQCRAINDFIQCGSWDGLSEEDQLRAAVNFFTNLVYHMDLVSYKDPIDTIAKTKDALMHKLSSFPDLADRAALIKQVNDASETIAAIRDRSSRSRLGHDMSKLSLGKGGSVKPRLLGGNGLGKDVDPGKRETFGPR